LIHKVLQEAYSAQLIPESVLQSKRRVSRLEDLAWWEQFDGRHLPLRHLICEVTAIREDAQKGE
jgi:hypothetical protein